MNNIDYEFIENSFLFSHFLFFIYIIHGVRNCIHTKNIRIFR